MLCYEVVPLPGPYWRAPTFCRVLQSAGLVRPGRLSRPDLDLLFIAQCGRGGAMSVVDFWQVSPHNLTFIPTPPPEGVLDFWQALAEVGRRLYPADESPVGRVERLLAEHFSEGQAKAPPPPSLPLSPLAQSGEQWRGQTGVTVKVLRDDEPVPYYDDEDSD